MLHVVTTRTSIDILVDHRKTNQTEHRKMENREQRAKQTEPKESCYTRGDRLINLKTHEDRRNRNTRARKKEA